MFSNYTFNFFELSLVNSLRQQKEKRKRNQILKLFSFFILLDQRKKKRPVTAMIICVKTLTGKLIPVDVRSADTILYLKYLIYEQEGYEPESQRLIYLARVLQDEQSLSDYGIRGESTVYLALESGLNGNAGIMSDSSLDIVVKTLIGKGQIY